MKDLDNLVCYQIYPRTFYGMDKPYGTIKGIIQKLEYIKELGIDLIWINPIYASSMVDNGYDITDYYKVNPIFGDYTDVKELIEKAHALQIKIMFDLVLNHTSKDHEWFKKSESGDPYYQDFYIWLDNAPNWGNFFGGSAFTYSQKRKQYYMHCFDKTMPDLNYKNTNVLKEMRKVVRFLLDLGVDGFRLDAISHLGKAPFEKIEPYDQIVYDYSKFSNLPLVRKVLKEIKKEFKKDTITVGEIGGPHTADDALRYTENELSMVFTFAHVACKKDGKTDIANLRSVFNEYQEKLNQKGHIGLYWLNHDHVRLMSQYGDVNDSVKSGSMLAVLLYLQRGTPFIYNGEEIGMTNYNFTKLKEFSDCKVFDEFAISNLTLQKFLNRQNLNSREHARTAMQWSNQKYAGFSTVKPKVLLNLNYKHINTESQLNGESLLNEYKKIIKIRKSYKQFMEGKYESIFLHDDIISYKRDEVLVICNLSKNKINLKLSYKNIIYSNYHTFTCIMPYHALVVEL